MSNYERIIKQPNEKWAVYDDINDGWLLKDSTEGEVKAFLEELWSNRAKKAVAEEINRVKGFSDELHRNVFKTAVVHKFTMHSKDANFATDEAEKEVIRAFLDERKSLVTKR